MIRFARLLTLRDRWVAGGIVSRPVLQTMDFGGGGIMVIPLMYKGGSA